MVGTISDILTLSNQYGIAWVLVIALGIAYYLEVKDRKNNTIPIALFEYERDRNNMVIENDNKIIGILEKLVEMTRLALNRKGE